MLAVMVSVDLEMTNRLKIILDSFMKNTKLILLLTIVIFVTSCKTNKKDDFSLIGFSYNRVIQNPTSGIMKVGAPAVYCEIQKTYLISKDTIYFYLYNDSTKEKTYRYSINKRLQSLLNKGLINSIDTLKELKDSTYILSPITVFDEKNDSIKIRNYQMFRLDNKSQKLIDSLNRILSSAETKELNDTTKIYNLNKKIEKYNIVDRRPDIYNTVH